jgi:pimeloyl-ACP methyl ester carboxylesterase
VLAKLGGRIEAHAITIAGFAGQPPISPPLLPRVRDELAAYIRSRKLERPIVVGHSLGGAMAYLRLSNTKRQESPDARPSRAA